MDRFEQVITSISTALEASNESLQNRNMVVHKLRKRFNRLNDEYKNSAGFSDTLDEVLERLSSLKKNNEDVFTCIKYLLDAFDSHRNSASTVPKNGPSNTSNGQHGSGTSPTTSVGSVRQIRLKETMLRRAEDFMRRLKKDIERAQNEELSAEDLDKDHNAFTDLERLRKRFGKQAEALSRFGNVESAPVKKSFPVYTGSGFEAVDKAVTKLIRPKSATKRNFAQATRPYNVPNYTDLVETITKTNEGNNLGLSEERIEDMARSIADQVYQILWKRRTQGMKTKIEELFATNDSLPECEDQSLTEKLSNNDKQREAREAEVELLVEKAGQLVADAQGIEDDDPEAADECRESDLSNNEESDDEQEREREREQEQEHEVEVEDRQKSEWEEEEEEKAEKEADNEANTNEEEAQPELTECQEVVEVASNTGTGNGHDIPVKTFLDAEKEEITIDGDDTDIVNDPVPILSKLQRPAEKRKLSQPSTDMERDQKEKKIEVIDLCDDD